MPRPKATSYQSMSQQLDELLEWFEGSSFNVDEAIEKYEQAMQLLKQMEDYLKTAENKVKKINAKFD